jgi:hypothetical protein
VIPPIMEVVEGWSGALPFTLTGDGDPLNLTGLTVGIVLKDGAGTVVKNTTAGISVTASTAGEVSWTPATSSGDVFVASKTPYKVRFKLTDGLGKVIYVPNIDEDLIVVNVI